MPRAGVATSNDLTRSFKTMEEEISGSECLNTELSIDRYPLIAEGESRLTFQRKRRKSDIFGREGLDTETPVSLHHFLYSVHLLWYTTRVVRLLARETCLATREEYPSCLANRWIVSRHEDEATGAPDETDGSGAV